VFPLVEQFADDLLNQTRSVHSDLFSVVVRVNDTFEAVGGVLIRVPSSFQARVDDVIGRLNQLSDRLASASVNRSFAGITISASCRKCLELAGQIDRAVETVNSTVSNAANSIISRVNAVLDQKNQITKTVSAPFIAANNTINVYEQKFNSNFFPVRDDFYTYNAWRQYTSLVILLTPLIAVLIIIVLLASKKKTRFAHA